MTEPGCWPAAVGSGAWLLARSWWRSLAAGPQLVAEPGCWLLAAGCWLLACWWLLPAAHGSGAWLLETKEKSRSSKVMSSMKNTYMRADIPVGVNQKITVEDVCPGVQILSDFWTVILLRPNPELGSIIWTLFWVPWLAFEQRPRCIFRHPF